MFLCVINLALSLLLESDKAEKIKDLYAKAYQLRNTNPDSALFYSKSSIELAQKYSLNYELSVGYNVSGLIHKNIGQYDSSIYFYEKSISLRRALGLEKELASLYMNIGVVKDKKGDYASAINSYLVALKIQEKYKDSLNLARLFQNIGALWEKQGEISKALDANNKSLNLFRALGDSMGIANVYNSLGLIFQNKGELNKSIEFFNESIALKKHQNDTRGLANSFNNLGNSYFLLNNYKNSEYYVKKADSINSKLGNQKGSANSKLKLANINRKLNRYLNAYEFCIRALDLAESIGSKDLLSTIYLELSMIYESQGDLKNALITLSKYDSLKSIVFNETKSKQIAELQTKYETEKKEKEIAIQKAEIEQKTMERNNLLISLSVLVLLAVIMIGFYVQRQKNLKLTVQRNEIKHDQQVTKILQEQEIKSFDAMIKGQEQERKRVAEDLHDRLGSLLSATKMHYEAALSDPDKINSEQAKKVGQLLDRAVEGTRQISHNMLSGVLSKFGLKAALEDLRETVESSDGLKMELETNEIEQLDGEQELQLYRMVQELVSNSMKHADAKKISISLKKQEQRYLLVVEDDGKGFDTSLNSDGIGLRNISYRTSLLKGEVNFKSRIGEGTRTEVIIPA